MKYFDMWFMQQDAGYHDGSLSLTSTMHISGNLVNIAHTYICTFYRKKLFYRKKYFTGNHLLMQC